MKQFLSDQIEQLDLALDQISVGDRNFDRFAFLLIDNVVELALYQHAKDCSIKLLFSRESKQLGYDEKTITRAKGKYFHDKIKLAVSSGLISREYGRSIRLLHEFRNSSYHSGLRHEAVLHSLSLFYFKIACDLLINYEPHSFSYRGQSELMVSMRTRKYIGSYNPSVNKTRNIEVFKSSFDRMKEVAETFGNELISDLISDMSRAISNTIDNVEFLMTSTSEDRLNTIKGHQAFKYRFTEDVKKLAEENNIDIMSDGYISWIEENYSKIVKKDPIEKWISTLTSLKKEINVHEVFKTYCDFIKNSKELRELLQESVNGIENYHADMRLGHYINVLD